MRCSLNDNLTSLSSATATSTHTYQSRSIKFFKRNGTVMVYMDGFVDIASASTVLCTLPSGFTPGQNFVYDQWIANQKFRFTIGTDGKFSVYNYGSDFSDGNIYHTFTYVL